MGLPWAFPVREYSRKGVAIYAAPFSVAGKENAIKKNGKGLPWGLPWAFPVREYS